MQTIETPCIQVCAIDPATGLCRGCKRTLNEIARWASMGAHERACIMRELPGRASIRTPILVSLNAS